ncbi:Cystathionine beta-synthase [Leucoagaricus sp. SymC.cos]|nr:Cystathionine beta-synthase [Leucoagaricus sp. SymC.cos]
MTTTLDSTIQATSFSTSSADKYRGAVVEDLQLPPAFALPSTEPIARAVELAYERDFSHIPVLDKNRKPLGYIDVAYLKEKWEAGQADPVRFSVIIAKLPCTDIIRLSQNDKISKFMVKFVRKASEPYTLVTPWSSLSELEDFLKSNIFALVTDNERKFVLAVATSQDLENFVSRRGL